MNITNSSSSGAVVDLCINVRLICGLPIWGELMLVINIVSIIVNILHYATLQVARKTSEEPHVITAWQKMLVQFAITDVACGLGGLIRACIFRRLVYGKSSAIGAVINFLSDIGNAVRFYVVALACYDRLIAIRWPFRYSSDILITRVNTICTVVWCCSSVFIILRDALFHDVICIHDIIGVTSLFDNRNAAIMSYSFLLPPALVIIILNVILLVELHKIRGTTTQPPNIANKATLYTAISSCLFIACLSPGFLGSVLNSVDLTFEDTLNYIGYLLHSIYGILNTVVYGWMNARYRQAFLALVTGNCNKKARVADENNVASSLADTIKADKQ